eukprot:6036681-Prymnesium_polylepis.1
MKTDHDSRRDGRMAPYSLPRTRASTATPKGVAIRYLAVRVHTRATWYVDRTARACPSSRMWQRTARWCARCACECTQPLAKSAARW